MRDDEQFNTQFVQTVQKYKCLYDYTQTDYKIIQIQDKAWQEIANKFKETPINCKERWKNIRGCLTRSIKQQSNKNVSTPHRKPYYLTSHLDFLVPFTKSRQNKFISPRRTDTTVVLKAPEPKQEVSDCVATSGCKLNEIITYTPIEYHESEEMYYETEENMDEVQETEEFIENDEEIIEEQEREMIQIQAAPPVVQQDESADWYFLKSILPDIQSMNRSQNRKLKIQILSLIDSIITEG